MFEPKTHGQSNSKFTMVNSIYCEQLTYGKFTVVNSMRQIHKCDEFTAGGMGERRGGPGTAVVDWGRGGGQSGMW